VVRAPPEGAALSRRFDAVVFDLFGTLVPEFTRREFYGAVEEAARILGADVETFRAEWVATAIDRQTGAWTSLDHGVRTICATLGLDEPDEELLAQALAPRAEMYARMFHPRPGAIETLRILKERGYPVALVSMCASDIPEIWRASPLAAFVDIEIFSSETGLRKPDPAIYLAACDGLGVRPDVCLYCGDGAYGELSGAEAVGMTAYLIRDPDLPPEEALRPEPEDWGGPAVDDLRELLPLLPG
jgi:putative hydrolase of the HAD superfamily